MLLLDFQRRGAMVALQILLPYILDRGLSLLEQQVHQNVDISLEVKTRLLDAIPLVKHIITILQRCHLAAFYLNGLFYHLAKRVTAIYYVSKSTFVNICFSCPNINKVVLVWMECCLSFQATYTMALMCPAVVQGLWDNRGVHNVWHCVVL